MSMQTDCIYGMGFEVDLTNKQLKNFILKHENTVKSLKRGNEVLDYIVNTENKDLDILEDFADYTNTVIGNESAYGIIVDVIYKETGIPIEYHAGQEDDTDVIIYTARYPWELSDTEKLRTADSLENTFNKYIAEFENPSITYNDSIRREYFGQIGGRI